MEFIIFIIVAYILYKLFFSSGGKKKRTDAIIGASVQLGVPPHDAHRILDTEIQELSKLLAMTALPRCTVSNLPVHERMAHCINIIYKRNN